MERVGRPVAGVLRIVRLAPRMAGLLIRRTLTSELWIVRVFLLILAAGSSVYFLWPYDTFGVAPRAYVGMAWLLSERQWGVVFGALAALTVVTLVAEQRGECGPWCRLTWQIHGPLWSGIGASFALNAPGAWSSWIFILFGLGGELIFWQSHLPTLLARWGRGRDWLRGRGRGDGGGGQQRQ